MNQPPSAHDRELLSSIETFKLNLLTVAGVFMTLAVVSGVMLALAAMDRLIILVFGTPFDETALALFVGFTAASMVLCVFVAWRLGRFTAVHPARASAQQASPLRG